MERDESVVDAGRYFSYVQLSNIEVAVCKYCTVGSNTYKPLFSCLVVLI